MLFLTFLSITNWPTALLRVAGCPCACGDSLFLLSTSTKAQSSGQNGHDHDRLYQFQSISPPFVASCTARVGSHGHQRICQVLWMYCRGDSVLATANLTPRLQPAYPHRPFRTVRSRLRYAY